MPYDTNKPIPFGGLDDKDAMLLEDVQSPNMRNVRLDRDRIVRGPGAALFAGVPIPGSTVGGGMATGSFTKKANGTGTQSVNHGLGIAPKAALFFVVNAASGTVTTKNATLSIGMTDGTDDRCISTSEENQGGLTDCGRRARDAVISLMEPVETVGTIVAEAVFSSWNATSFTLNWSTNDSNAWTVYYVLFGTSSMNAKVSEWSTGTSAGNVSNTATGFTPGLAIHLHAGTSGTSLATDLKCGIGIMSATEQGSGSWTSEHDQSVIDASSESSLTRCLSMLDVGRTTFDYEATFVSFNADGFTVNFSNAPSSAVDVFSLMLDDVDDISIHSITRPLSSVPNTQAVTTPDFEPSGLLTFSHCTASGGNPSDAGEFMLGAMNRGGLGRVIYRGSVTGTGSTAGGTTPQGVRVISTDSRMFAANYGSGSTLEFSGYVQATSDTGYSVEWVVNNNSDEDPFIVAALQFTTSTLTEVGPIRNYAQVYVGSTGTEKVLLLANKTVAVYNDSTEEFDVSSEAYTITAGRRYYIANTQDIAAWAVDATSTAPNLRQYDGSSYSDLITSGTNHKARFAVAFNDRIISGYTYHTGAVHPTQIRWCRSGQVNNWDTSTGSAGTLEVLETSNGPITGMFVMGERAYITKAREVIELIPTGTTSPVFRQQTRVFGTGCIAPYSFGFGEFFAFFLGPDDVYLFDGTNLQSIGEPVRRTISSLVNYTALDDIQGEYLQSSAEYWLRIGNNIFVYDFRRKRWQRDFYADQTAIGSLKVGGIITTDVDHSEFMVMGTTGNETLRISENQTTILGGAIDSYIETKDFYATRPARGGDGAVTSLRFRNVTRSLAIQTDPGAVVEIGVSTDRGTTWDAVNVTADSQGIAQRWCNASYSTVRFRFRNATEDTFNVYGAYSWRWDSGGMAIGP